MESSFMCMWCEKTSDETIGGRKREKNPAPTAFFWCRPRCFQLADFTGLEAVTKLLARNICFPLAVNAFKRGRDAGTPPGPLPFLIEWPPSEKSAPIWVRVLLSRRRNADPNEHEDQGLERRHIESRTRWSSRTRGASKKAKGLTSSGDRPEFIDDTRWLHK